MKISWKSSILVAGGVFAAGAGLGVLVSQPPAFAALDHNYLYPTQRYWNNCTEGGPGNARVCRQEDSSVSWYMDSNGEFELETPDRDDVNAALDANYRPTHLSFTYDSSPTFSGNYETDLVYQEGTLPSPYVGYTWCDDVRGNIQCEQTYVRIRGNGVYTPGLVCHETGHAVGLVHGEDTSSGYGNQDSSHMGCMVKDNVPGAAVLRSAQKADINDAY